MSVQYLLPEIKNPFRGNTLHCHNIGRAPLLCRLITSTPCLHYVADVTALVGDLRVITHAVLENGCSGKKVHKADRETRQGKAFETFPAIGGH